MILDVTSGSPFQSLDSTVGLRRVTSAGHSVNLLIDRDKTVVINRWKTVGDRIFMHRN